LRPVVASASAFCGRILPAFRSSVQPLKPPARGSTFYFDREVPGLALRITAANVRTWTLFHRAARRQRCFKLGRHPDLSLADAREAARNARSLVAKGRDPAGERRDSREAPTFKELGELYLRLHVEPHKKPVSGREDRRMIAVDLKPWHPRLARNLTRLDVQRLLPPQT
jgi:hypothetical protein